MLTTRPGNIDLRFLPMGISLVILSGIKAIAQKTIDSFKIKGNVAVSGLIQTGNEMRTVASLLSDIAMGNTRYEIEPLTSIAYSTKPGKIVERELLENVILRFFQNHIFYPALGISFETSLLRKIDYRWSIGPTIVWNLIKSKHQMIKLGIGYNHEFTQYLPYAFIPPPVPGDNYYSLHSDQIYIRLRGRNELLSNKLIFTYDFFFQPSIRDLMDYQWTLIGSLDIPISKKFSIRASAVDSYEEFVATGVYQNNFRLTYGINYSF